MEHLSMDIRVPIEQDNPSICRNEETCIRCGMCKQVCTEQIGVHGTYTLEQTHNQAVCINCGQCANVCPPDSITEKYEYPAVRAAIHDPDKIVIVSTSPSVRAALGEEFGMPDGSFVQGKMVALLRKLGVDYVLDTNFAADLTIVEEASELIERITKKTAPLPQFTSCCPAWVKFAEMYYPELLPNISSAKSPIGMQGPTIKTYFATEMGIDPRKIVNVALTPCTAKKFEIRREEMCASGKYYDDPNLRDMDMVITTRELASWAREEHVDFMSLEDSDYDRLMGEASGAAVIFGNTGGVMEAALRTANDWLTGTDTPAEKMDFSAVRGTEGIKEATYTVGGVTLKVAICSGLANAKKLLTAIRNGEADYQFVEVMACPGGCVNGGGQPFVPASVKNFVDVRAIRAKALYSEDEALAIRKSHQNPSIIELYNDYLGAPGSEKAHHLLHTSYVARKRY